ncbi:efflux RND transporter periplasmic adaptor subunit [Rhizobium rhizogenes]|uniref:efflux RND transporter periplasmic adaptor subunit n=1 Tax=Rhizobium rhizogenes TaxID=359 RepID=UPI0022C05C5A|nr:efflux RND transporter periplasmic adaptor subunit [Rhizobium rhizogenes]MCZ7486109.1 efflux RND transporter periplasmic adaptor subunit [Rhizobium rhizogenes]
MNSRYLGLLAAMVAVIVGSGGILYGRGSQSTNAASDTSLLSKVARGDIEETVLALGSLEPPAIVRVGAQVTGQIQAISVSPGQSVKAGDLLAEIDAVPQKNALRVAQASLKDSQAKLDEKQVEIAYARRELDRKSKLNVHSVVSRTEFEEAELKHKALLTQLKSLEAQFEEGKVALETAQANLSYTRITAPIDGRILSIPVQQGQTLNSAQTSPTIAVVADVSTMVVKMKISEADVERTRAGQKVTFTSLGNPATVYESELKRVDLAPPTIGNEPSRETASDAAKNSAVYYEGVAVVENSNSALRTKMTVQARISVGRASDVLMVPWSALKSSTNDGQYVLKVLNGDGSVSDRNVRIGLTDKTNAQILSGIEEGEAIVLNADLPNKGN